MALLPLTRLTNSQEDPIVHLLTLTPRKLYQREQMRMAATSMRTTQGMQVSFDFAAHLDQLVQTGDAGFRLMDGMVVALERGVNPSPPRDKAPTSNRRRDCQ